MHHDQSRGKRNAHKVRKKQVNFSKTGGKFFKVGGNNNFRETGGNLKQRGLIMASEGMDAPGFNKVNLESYRQAGRRVPPRSGHLTLDIIALGSRGQLLSGQIPDTHSGQINIVYHIKASL